MPKVSKIISVAENLFNVKNGEYEVSTGLLVKYKGKYIFAIQNEDRWKRIGNKIEAGLVGIGGKLERGETVVDCVRRESIEELGTEIELIDSGITYLIEGNSIRESVLKTLPNEPRPYFIILLERSEPGRKPSTIVFSYLGNLARKPKPVDVSALLLADDSSFSHLASGPKTVKFLGDRSAQLIERNRIPSRLYLRPYGTLLAYLRLLQIRNRRNKIK